MGQTSDKAKQKLQQIGYYTLPNNFSIKQNGLYISQSSPIVLKSFPVLLNPSDVETYTNHLQFRKIHQQNLIQILYVNVKQQQENYCKFLAFLEYMPFRLEQTYSVHFNNMVKILYHCLKGFKILFEKFGYFTIDSSMIGVNNQGQPKCWCNKKYSQPIPKPSYSYKKMANPQNSMVQQLKEIFKCQTDRMTIPHQFILENNSFDGLMSELINKYGVQWLNGRIQFNLVRQVPANIIQNKGLIINHPVFNINPQQIRFNYQMKESSTKIVFNKRVEASKSVQNSRKSNAKVNFSYQANTTVNSPIINKELQRVNIQTMVTSK